MKKKVGIIGSGGVAKTLAEGFLKHGYNVMVGTRDTSKLEAWQTQTGGKIKLGSFADAAKFGQVIVLAVKGKHAKEAVKMAGTRRLAGKTVLDATNPIDDTPPINGALRFFTKANQSLMEILQKTAPKANFVKAFNSVGAAFMVNPEFPDGKPTMFICGNDAGAKEQARAILDLFGWDTEDVGAAESAGAVEQLCIIWCAPGFLRNQWTHAFRLMKLN
jgi:predicted dinucleotide-binding enzyme